MGWNNMKSFSIPGSEACQKDRVWHDQHRTDVQGMAFTLYFCALEQSYCYRLHYTEIQNTIRSTRSTLLLSLELIS